MTGGARQLTGRGMGQKRCAGGVGGGMGQEGPRNAEGLTGPRCCDGTVRGTLTG